MRRSLSRAAGGEAMASGKRGKSQSVHSSISRRHRPHGFSDLNGQPTHLTPAPQTGRPRTCGARLQSASGTCSQCLATSNAIPSLRPWCAPPPIALVELWCGEDGPRSTGPAATGSSCCCAARLPQPDSPPQKWLRRDIPCPASGLLDAVLALPALCRKEL